MRKPGSEGDDGDETPPGGRALQRLRQFEQERGLDATVPSDKSGHEGAEDVDQETARDTD